MRSTGLRTWPQARGSGPGPAVDLLPSVLAAAAAAFSVTGHGLAAAGLTDAAAPSLLVTVPTTTALIAVIATTVSAPPVGLAWLGHAVVPRALLIVAVVAQALQVDLSWFGTLLVAGCALVLLVVLVTEPTLRRTMAVTVPVAVGLPGHPLPRTRRTVGARTAWWIAFGAVAIGWVLVLTAATSGVSQFAVWWVVPAAAAAAIPVAVVLDGGANSARARRVRKRVPDAIAQLAPAFVLHLASPNDTAYQVEMWLPYLRRTRLPFFVLTRHPLPSQTLAQIAGLPVVEARLMSDVEQLIVPSLRAACYVNTSAGNGLLVRFQHLRHIYLGHGDSDKATSASSLHAMYDAILVAGPVAVERYRAAGVDIASDRFHVVGRPQTEAIAAARGPIAEQPAGPVLYAPTWRGQVPEAAVSSLLRGEQIVSALLALGRTVVFRPHPFSRDDPDDAAAIRRIERLLERDKRKTGRPHRWGAAVERRQSILDCLNDCAALVTDRSAVLTDYLQSGKPYAVVMAEDAGAGETQRMPGPVHLAGIGGYPIAADLSDLDAQLGQMLGADPAAAQRDDVRAAYLGPKAGSAEPFVTAVRDLASHRSAGFGEEAAPAEGEAPDAPAASSVRESSGRPSQQRALNAAVAAIAAVTMLAALLGAAQWIVLTGALLTAVAIVLTTWMPRQLPRMLDRHSVARLLLICAAAAAWPYGEPSAAVPTGSANTPEIISALVVSGTVLLAVAVAVERITAQGWRRSGPLTRNLLERPAEVGERVPRALAALLGMIVAITGVAVAAVPVWSIVWVGLGVVVFILAAEAFARSQQRAAALLDTERRVLDAVAELAPQFVVHFAAEAGGAYQLAMWLPYFQRLDRPWMIVTRDLELTRAVAKAAAEADVKVPILHRPGVRALNEIVMPSLTTAFYVNNGTLNTHLIARTRLTHVWLGHGDSEKAGSHNPVHQIYDLIFTAGQAGIDRYARHGVQIPASRFRIVGRPQVEVIGQAGAPIGEIAQPTVIYAPTWQGPYADMRLYSLPAGQQIVEHLLERGCRVIFRAHPLNRRFKAGSRLVKGIGALLAADRESTGREHLWGAAAEKKLSLPDCFNASDAMIADISAVVSDYLYARKPLALVAVGRTRADLIGEIPAARGAYVLDHDLRNLAEVCADLLGGDPLAGTRDEVARYYLGDIPPQRYADVFVETARTVIDAKPARP